jgi:hypothetical protein
MDKSVSNWGSICSILLGISYVLVGIFHSLSPVEHRISSGPEVFLPAIASGFSFSYLVTLSFALGAVVAFAAIPAIADRFLALNPGLVLWTRNLSLVGYAVLAINEFTILARWPTIANAYVQGDASVRAAITAEPLVLLDHQGWLMYGAVGLFIFVTSALALRHRAIPLGLAYIGLAAGFLFWMVIAGFILENELLISIAAGFGGVVLVPAFYIWIGILLRRDAGAAIFEPAVESSLNLAEETGNE